MFATRAPQDFCVCGFNIHSQPCLLPFIPRVTRFLLFTQIYDWLEEKAASCPSSLHCQVFPIGKSSENRDLKVFKVSFVCGLLSEVGRSHINNCKQTECSKQFPSKWMSSSRHSFYSPDCANCFPHP